MLMVENLYCVQDPLRAVKCDQYDFKVVQVEGKDKWKAGWISTMSVQAMDR